MLSTVSEQKKSGAGAAKLTTSSGSGPGYGSTENEQLRSSGSEALVSADLLSSVLDVRFKRNAKLLTNHHLLVCNLHLVKSPGQVILPNKIK